MSQELADSLDLQLAWARVKFDRPDRCFLSHPFLLELVELDLSSWLAGIKQRIADGYVASTCLTVQAPKGHWQVRPGAHLRLEDEVVLNALIGRYLPNIADELRELQGDPDVAYQLASGTNRRDWLIRGFRVWNEWREKSKRRVQEGARFVLFADISAFYENVDLSRLASDVRRLGFNDESAALLSECLNRWAQPRGKGIPQGYSGVDILAKIYLASVDRNLRNEGFKYLRYVDDIRIFCQSHQEAQRALVILTELLRVRGLNVQSAKTYIVDAEKALLEIDGVGPVISQIRADLIDELREAAASSYGTVADLERWAEENPEQSKGKWDDRTSHDLSRIMISRPSSTTERTLREFLVSIRLPVQKLHQEQLAKLKGKNETDAGLGVMSKLASSSPDRIAEYFVTYLTHRYADRRHVRRVAAWVGMIVMGIRRGAGQDWHISNARQLWFTHGDRTFKVRYDHQIGNEGGIEIVEVLAKKGNPDGEVLATFRNLELDSSSSKLFAIYERPEELQKAQDVCFKREEGFTFMISDKGRTTLFSAK